MQSAHNKKMTSDDEPAPSLVTLFPASGQELSALFLPKHLVNIPVLDRQIPRIIRAMNLARRIGGNAELFLAVGPPGANRTISSLRPHNASAPLLVVMVDDHRALPYTLDVPDVKLF
jgi:hypothetical protein